jgi:poly-beta-1,6-N-acetyl-D-glucosamine synthase
VSYLDRGHKPVVRAEDLLVLTLVALALVRNASREPQVPGEAARLGQEPAGSTAEGHVATRTRILVVVPAHNEERDLEHCIETILAQTRPADRIAVVLDNCTDGTEKVANTIRDRLEHDDRLPDLEVYETHDNAGKKAGALNQILLRQLLPHLDDEDMVLVLDADGWLFPDFLETAEAKLARHRDAGAVCGSYYGPPDRRGLIHLLQRNEYARFARITNRQKQRAYVLSGVSSMYRVATLRAVYKGRTSGKLPGVPGDLWNVTAATEDIEMTHAAKSLGYRPMAPAHCQIHTDTMPTWEKLKHQRIRWQRGMLDSLGSYGIRKMSWNYYRKLLTLYLSSLIPLLWVFCVIASYALFGGVHWLTWWLLVIPLMIGERVITVRREGMKAMLLAVSLLPEVAYETWRSYLYWIALFNWIRKTERVWHPT